MTADQPHDAPSLLRVEGMSTSFAGVHHADSCTVEIHLSSVFVDRDEGGHRG